MLGNASLLAREGASAAPTNWTNGRLVSEPLGEVLGKAHALASIADPQLLRPSAHGPPHSGGVAELGPARSERLLVTRYFRHGAASVLLWAALTLLLGLLYYNEKQHPPKLDPEGVNVSLHDRERLDRRKWRFGLFECAEMPSLCLMSFLCAPIRWADTMRMAGLMRFIWALILVVGLTVLGSLTLGIGLFILVGVCVHCRQRLRDKFDIPNHSWGLYCADILTYVCCPWCAIAQEARQVEEAHLARHPCVREDYMARRSLGKA